MKRLSLLFVSLFGIQLAAILIFVGCGGTNHPAKTLPALPSCAPVAGHAQMGVTLRCRRGYFKAYAPEPGQTGIDLSNNDPVYGAANWRAIRQHASFVYLKVTEGLGFHDSTAATMAREARAAGLLVGAYDFQHVCGNDPRAEASFFIAMARADGLLSGTGVLPLIADAEKSYGSCSASAWERVWSAQVHQVGVKDGVYSDPGYYIPVFGCFADADIGWIADLGGFQSLCRLPTVIHQYSFTAFDGVSSVDGDVYRGTYSQLQALASAKSKPPAPKPRCDATCRRRAISQLTTRRTRLRHLLSSRGCRRRKANHISLGPKCMIWFLHGDQANHALHVLGVR